MENIEPENYNDYGEIVKPEPPRITYGRTLSAHDQHRIHETKDLFESSCSYCQRAMKKKMQSYWGDDK